VLCAFASEERQTAVTAKKKKKKKKKKTKKKYPPPRPHFIVQGFGRGPLEIASQTFNWGAEHEWPSLHGTLPTSAGAVVAG
jgi:hypothetical protein